MVGSEEEDLRREIKALLAAGPPAEQLTETFTGRVLAWLATPHEPAAEETVVRKRSRRKKSRRAPKV